MNHKTLFLFALMFMLVSFVGLRGGGEGVAMVRASFLTASLVCVAMGYAVLFKK